MSEILHSSDEINHLSQPPPQANTVVAPPVASSDEVDDLIASCIEGVAAMHPANQARRNIFLQDDDKKNDRLQLLERLSVWEDILSQPDEMQECIVHAINAASKYGELLKKNLANAIYETRPLEAMYLTVHVFFKNAGSENLDNISFINCGIDALKDLDNTGYIDLIYEELKKNYDRIDLRNNYSLLLIPGYLGSHKIMEKWAKIAHENKAILVTDFEHLDEGDDVMEMFELANLGGAEKYWSSVLMTCNWLVGRGRGTEVDEAEDLFIPPSGALCGKIYTTLMSQVAAGKKYGALNDVAGVKFELKKSEITNLEKMGLVPMVKESGKVIAYSAKTLFNGDNLGLQTYSVVRVFDYVTKVLMDFLNRRAFENFNAGMRKDLMMQIVKFLDTITGPGKLVANFTIKRFEQDATQKDRIHLDIYMKPYFPSKNFMIKMEGKKNEEGNEWGTAYDDE